MINIQDLRIEKITLNIGVGEPGDKLDKAVKLLEILSNKKPVRTITMKRIPTWGVRPKLAIACKVTLRGKEAEELLGRLLQDIDNKLPEKKFDNEGNFSFGIEEYILIPGVQYNIDIGIIGLEVAVTLSKIGYRIKRRVIHKAKVPSRHRITKEQAMKFINDKYGIVSEEK